MAAFTREQLGQYAGAMYKDRDQAQAFIDGYIKSLDDTVVEDIARVMEMSESLKKRLIDGGQGKEVLEELRKIDEDNLFT